MTMADQAVEQAIELTRRRMRGERFELYGRVAETSRITRTGSVVEPLRRDGHDEGLALRWVREGAEVVFAASSGLGTDAVETVTRQIRQLPARAGASSAPMADSPLSTPVDADPEVGQPDSDRLLEWLDEALGRLSDEIRTVPGLALHDAWVEVARTAEFCCNPGGVVQRSRRRVWAMARLKGGRAAVRRPLVGAARSLDRLATGDWADRLRSRDPQELPDRSPDGLLTLFSPETSAVLVNAMARTVHREGKRSDVSVGTGWDLRWEPNATGALMGGAFDDVAMQGEARRLADGNRALASLGGPGWWRRPSFRDPPQLVAQNLVLPDGSKPPENPCFWVTDATIHPMGAQGWLLQLSGTVRQAGEPIGSVAERFLRCTPAELVQRCVGRVGESKQSHLGLVTPALLFRGLDFAS